MKRILITGASGFIGQSLIKTLLNKDKKIRATIRSNSLFSSNTETEYINVGDINGETRWEEILDDIDCIIHCAGQTHIREVKKEDDQSIYHSVNVDGTKQLAKQATESKVKRLIFLSSIKVNGECTATNSNDTNKDFLSKKIFMQSDKPNPENPYAKSKLEAEKVLWEISAITGLEVVIVRLPLVYGYGAKGNLVRLINLVNSGIPLPLSLVRNKRSMIGIDNIIDLLIRCIDHPEANGKTFLASDGEDLSTPELIKLIASSIGRKANLFPLPIFILKSLGSIFGKSEEINRLVGSLRIDNSYTKKILDWTPPISVKEGIRRMVQGK
jgi:nucleoside-diphosphate-sugar epimerase